MLPHKTTTQKNPGLNVVFPQMTNCLHVHERRKLFWKALRRTIQCFLAFAVVNTVMTYKSEWQKQ